MSSFSQQPAQYIVFQLAKEWFALPVEHLRGIERWRTPTPVPGTPPSILGIINQRGALLTVLDARVLLNLPTEAPSRRTRLLLTHSGEVDLALVTDHVGDMITLETPLEPAPARATSLSRGLIQSPFGLASLLDLDAVLGAVNVG